MSDPTLDLQRADFSQSAAPASAETSAPGAPACMSCRVPISDRYYTRGEELLCERCFHTARDAGPPGSAPTRMLGALGLGLVAATLAGALWLLVTELTGYELGLIALVVGFMVGAAVRIGSRGLGGVPYQLLAVMLTYSAIVMTYVPQIAFELQNSQEFTAQIEEASAQQALEAEATIETSGAPPEPAMSDEQATAVTAWVIAVPLAYAAPFLMGFENAIGILIIGFALWQAWSMNARANLELKGPFRVGDAPVG